MVDQLTVLFMPESAYGPTNNCIGIGDVLRRRGHRVVFAAEASWAGKLTALGFAEDLVPLAPEPDTPQDAGRFWKDFIRDTAPEFRKPRIAQNWSASCGVSGSGASRTRSSAKPSAVS